MSKLNPVFTAITDIDDSIILNAKKPRRRPIAIAFAAAAAVLMLAGFAIAHRYGGVSVNGESAFDYNLTVQSITIPTVEEMEELGAVTQEGECFYEWETLPSNVFKAYGISPLMNENFSEEENNNNITVHPSIEGDPGGIMIDCILTDKNLGKDVLFRIFCTIKEGEGLNTEYNVNNSDNNSIETIQLNDGSSCIMVGWHLDDMEYRSVDAEFSYNGIAYSLHINDAYNEDMKQVLSDLGVL